MFAFTASNRQVNSRKGINDSHSYYFNLLFNLITFRITVWLGKCNLNSSMLMLLNDNERANLTSLWMKVGQWCEDETSITSVVCSLFQDTPILL